MTGEWQRHNWHVKQYQDGTVELLPMPEGLVRGPLKWLEVEGHGILLRPEGRMTQEAFRKFLEGLPADVRFEMKSLP